MWADAAQNEGMTTSPRKRLRRWAVPVGVTAAVAAISITVNASAHADDHPALPATTAAELLRAIASATPPAAFAGTVSETVDLGLPALPGMDNAGAGTLSLQSLVTGTHDFRVWESGPSLQRVAMLGQLAETEIVHNGPDVWTYASSSHTATHSTVPATRHDGAAAMPATADGPQTPTAMATAALAALAPTTAVTVDGTARVAGLAAYRLVLTPHDDRTLVGSVRIAFDAATHVPLQVEVFARGHDTPAIDVRFTAVSFAPIDPAIFVFTPPVGAVVTEGSTAGADSTAGAARAARAAGDRHGDATPSGGVRSGAAGAGQPAFLGTGWTAVAELAMPGAATPVRHRGDAPSATQMLDELSTPVPGGRVVSTALLSVLLSDDGHVYVGAVRPEDLQAVAASGHGL